MNNIAHFSLLYIALKLHIKLISIEFMYFILTIYMTLHTEFERNRSSSFSDIGT